MVHHTVKKNNNGIAGGTGTGFAPIDEELAALQDLGPKCRHLLTHGPMPVLATPIVLQIIQQNDKIEAENERRAQANMPLRPYLDPKDPRLDDFLAQQLLKFHLDTMMKDGAATIDRAMDGLKPLVGKRSPKSAREQAKSDRLARRYMRR